MSPAPRKRSHALRTVLPLLLSMLAALLYGATATAQAAGSVLEAESAQLSGGAAVSTEHPGYTGSGFVGGFTDANKGAASVAFTVHSEAAGAGSIALRYANGTTATMTLSLYVNGVRLRQVSLPATANWDTWATHEEAVGYRAGDNTVTWTFTTSDSGNVNLDNATPATPTTPTDPGPTTLTHQAEDAFFSGGAAKATTATGYEGSAYLSGLTATGARAVFSVNAPAAATFPLSVRYRTPGSAAATTTLQANGTTVRRLTLPGTGGAWATAATDVPLRAALNSLTLRTATGDNGDYQLDGIAVTGSTPSGTRGATLPYTAYEAENGSTNATTVGPDRTYLSVPSEASGRKAVVLDSTGEYVRFTLTKPANALTLRYSLPDNAAGTGTDATLSVYADGTALKDLPLSSEYSWVYGGYPYNNDPSQGSGHHFFDETRTLLGRSSPPEPCSRSRRTRATPPPPTPWTSSRPRAPRPRSPCPPPDSSPPPPSVSHRTTPRTTPPPSTRPSPPPPPRARASGCPPVRTTSPATSTSSGPTCAAPASGTPCCAARTARAASSAAAAPATSRT